MAEQEKILKRDQHGVYYYADPDEIQVDDVVATPTEAAPAPAPALAPAPAPAPARTRKPRTAALVATPPLQPPTPPQPPRPSGHIVPPPPPIR